MCGLFSIIAKNNVNEIKFFEALLKLKHRGPDFQNAQHFQFQDKYVSLGHSRLSIVDLNEGSNQPFRIGPYQIVFNGEIYNFKDIRQRLKKLGHVFNTQGDTEVVLSAFIEYGLEFVKHLNGMFSFVIYDSVKGEIIFGRDRAGVKPLYIYKSEGVVSLSSELCSIEHYFAGRLDLDIEGVSSYFKYGYIPNPVSIYKDVTKVLPRTVNVLRLRDLEIKSTAYWEISDQKVQPGNRKMSECEEELNDLLIESVRLRLNADVPVGLFLSGGYDSSLVAAIISKDLQRDIDTYTIGFDDENYDESINAREISSYLGLRNTTQILTKYDFLENIFNFSRFVDEPIADMSIVPTYFVSQLAAKRVKVVLSADGGDEMFSGYDKYASILKAYKYRDVLKWFKPIIDNLQNERLPLSADAIRKANKIKSIDNTFSFSSLYENSVSIFNQVEFEKYFHLPEVYNQGCFSIANSLFCESGENGMLQLDYLTYQADNILHKVDRMSMRASIEAREPLLDYRLTEYASRLPYSFKMNGNNRKIILKNILHKKIPKSMMDQRKRGFGAPLVDWLVAGKKEMLLDLLSDAKLCEYYKKDSLEAMTKAIVQNKPIDKQKLWSIVFFELWRKERSL